MVNETIDELKNEIAELKEKIEEHEKQIKELQDKSSNTVQKKNPFGMSSDQLKKFRENLANLQKKQKEDKASKDE